MHFAVVRQHRDFFRKEGRLECEGVLSRDEAKRLGEAANAAMKKRVAGQGGHISVPYSAFGRDLWRRDPVVKKAVTSNALAEIASELTQEKPLRLGYDDLYIGRQPGMLLGALEAKFVDASPTLTDISCLQGIVCAAMLCLEPGSGSKEAGSLFPTVSGNAVFFSPTWPMPLGELKTREGGIYLMIVYCKPNAVYFRQEGDPGLHELKNAGYQFGDRLNDRLNPIVFS